MKAVIYEKYGAPEVLKLVEWQKPVPKENEMLIKIAYATVTAGDIRIRSSDFPAPFWLPARLMFGLFKPNRNILGHEFSGVVEAVGNSVKGFKVGDQVFGTTTGLKYGSYAEYVCVPESWKSGVVALVPEGLSLESAAALPIGGMTAKYLIDSAKTQDVKTALVYGASGSVGSYALQLAKHLGATVTAVCREENFEMVKSLGADYVIDYRTADFENLQEKYDLIFNAVMKVKKEALNPFLNPNGQFVSVTSMTKEITNNLIEVGNLASKGSITPHIEKVYSLAEISEAHRYVDSGRKRGNVLIKMD